MTREDPELGLVRLCRVCGEWWPLDSSCYDRQWGVRGQGRFMSTCRACLAERRSGRRPAKSDTLYRRVRRQGPGGEAVRARGREASRRYYWRNVERQRERQRAYYAAQLDRAVQVGIGRPRMAA